jgi:phosphoribosylanthranilate isomerase
VSRVKICGITTAADAALCHDAGADLLGVILTRSVRQVDPGQAALIRQAVPGARLVGVVRDQAAAVLALHTKLAGLDVLQLHDCPDPHRWAAVADACGVPVLPALTTDQAAAVVGHLTAGFPAHLEGVLLDLPKTGQPADPAQRQLLWEVARHLLTTGLPIFLAGSLAASDLPAVRREVGACHLDVCRGTERVPGVKDPGLVRGFLTAARQPEVGRAS